MTLVYCQVEGFPLHLYHVCMGKCVILNYINFDRGGRNIFCKCVDKIRVVINSDKLKKLGSITVSVMV